MSKSDRARKREQRRGYAKPSAPRVIGANDNAVNDNEGVVVIAGVELTHGQAIRFRRAEANLQSRDLIVQRAGHRVMVELEAEIRERIERAGVESHVETVRRLEELRGVTIGQSKVEGAVGKHRVQRDGLETLYASGSIDRTQHAAGTLYRADYERVDPERALTPPALDATRVNAGHGGENWCQKRRQIEDRLWSIHRMICGVEAGLSTQRGAMPILPASHPSMRAIHALQEIAGKGRPVMDLATSGSGRARVRVDLIRGLNTCAIFYGLE